MTTFITRFTIGLTMVILIKLLVNHFIT